MTPTLRANFSLPEENGPSKAPGYPQMVLCVDNFLFLFFGVFLWPLMPIVYIIVVMGITSPEIEGRVLNIVPQEIARD